MNDLKTNANVLDVIMVVHDWNRQVDLGRLFIHDWQAYCVWKNRDRVDQGRPGHFKRAQPMGENNESRPYFE